MHARGKIAVTGATGRVGRHVVDVLEERGHDVVAISRSLGVDVVTGEGLAEALAGVETVIDTATGTSPEQQPATEFFSASARNLQQLGEQAGVQRIVVVSIIGIDRFSAGYQAAKQVQEKAMLAGPIPARILRAAQFHEFVAELVDWGRQDGVSYVPKMRTQLVAARTVAEALADLATLPDSAPSGTSTAPIPATTSSSCAGASRTDGSNDGSGRGTAASAPVQRGRSRVGSRCTVPRGPNVLTSSRVSHSAARTSSRPAPASRCPTDSSAALRICACTPHVAAATVVGSGPGAGRKCRSSRRASTCGQLTMPARYGQAPTVLRRPARPRRSTPCWAPRRPR